MINSNRFFFFKRQPLKGIFVTSIIDFIFKPECAKPETKYFLRLIPNEPFNNKAILRNL